MPAARIIEASPPIDYDDPDNNDWLVVNQFTVVEAGHNRRADVVVFVNGLPLGVLELKNPGDENATIWDAYTQLQTYKQQIPSLFAYNETLVVSDGLQARVGSLTANKEWFKPWRTIEGDEVAPAAMLELEVLIKGLFEPRRHVQFLRNFVVFEEDPHSDTLIKILAGYHQFHAVNQAVESTIRAPGQRATGAAGWSGTRRAPARACR
jgi:type I restriction enzyme, R subunit